MANALAEAVKLGLTKTVGVSNYSTSEMIEMYECLKKHGIQLASNQVEFSILRRTPETSGHIAECHKRGIAVLGYSPLVNYEIVSLFIYLFFLITPMIRLWVVLLENIQQQIHHLMVVIFQM